MSEETSSTEKSLEILYKSLTEEMKTLSTERITRLNIQQFINNFAVTILGVVVALAQIIINNDQISPNDILHIITPYLPLISILLSILGLTYTDQEASIARKYVAEHKLRELLQAVSKDSYPEIVSNWNNVFTKKDRHLKELSTSNITDLRSWIRAFFNGILDFAKLAPTFGLSLIILIIYISYNQNSNHSLFFIAAFLLSIGISVALFVGLIYINS